MADYRALLDQLDSRAEGKVRLEPDVTPDEAGKAVELAPRMHIPSPVVKSDVSRYEQLLESRDNLSILRQNPAIKSYVDRDPMNVDVSRDDFAQLDVLSKTWEALRLGFAGERAQHQLGKVAAAEPLTRL